mmetsp:Transcript_32373/g.52630  ORF Transcript_32373/g.52630 Transcript_32373/m.52630 type:complete len:163 (-) Transcript_32373:260-748(-)|eukprot:jgi/Bigna1/65133/fgenesh1_kg.98_\
MSTKGEGGEEKQVPKADLGVPSPKEDGTQEKQAPKVEVDASSSATDEKSKDEEDISVSLHSYRFMDTPVYIQLIKMKGSFYVWVGSQPPQMANLSISVLSSMDPVPSATTILGEDDGTRSSLAQRLAKRTKMVALVSYNLPPERDYLERFVLGKLTELLPKK